MLMNELLSRVLCPTCPTAVKGMGRPETVGRRGLSHLSHLSRSKSGERGTVSVSFPYASSDLLHNDAFALAWPESGPDGPFCRLPPRLPESVARSLEDLRGMGVPAENLPLALRCFSLNGWRLNFGGGSLRMEEAVPGARRRSALECVMHQRGEDVLAVLRAWELLQVRWTNGKMIVEKMGAKVCGLAVCNK